MTTSRSSEYHDPAMADFYNTVDRIKDQINSLSNIAKELKDMENSELKVTSDVNQLKAFREAVVNRVDKASLIVSKFLYIYIFFLYIYLYIYSNLLSFFQL